MDLWRARTSGPARNLNDISRDQKYVPLLKPNLGAGNSDYAQSISSSNVLSRFQEDARQIGETLLHTRSTGVMRA